MRSDYGDYSQHNRVTVLDGLTGCGICVILSETNEDQAEAFGHHNDGSKSKVIPGERIFILAHDDTETDYHDQ